MGSAIPFTTMNGHALCYIWFWDPDSLCFDHNTAAFEAQGGGVGWGMVDRR